MWQGREIVLCALAFLAGNLLGDLFTLSPAVYGVLSFSTAGIALWRPLSSRLLARPFPVWPLLALMLLGAASVQVGRMPVGFGTPTGESSALMAWASGCKASFSAWLGRVLPPGDELAVSRALAIGDKTGLPRDLRAAYRESGAMHLLALSGLHVGLLYALLAWLLRPLGGHRVSRLLRSAVVLVLLWTYALITGLSASISRAVLMITFYEISGHLSGDRDGLAALAGSALLLMLFRPESPRDIGFQLSYTAVLSILLLHPWLSRRLQTRSRLLTRIWELLSVSLCCQVTCGVLAWYYFGTFPRYFLLTTLLAIPLTTIVMYVMAVAVGTAGLASFAAGLLPASVPPSASAIASSAVPSSADWIVSALTTLSDSTADLLRWLLHLLNTLLRLIASL